MGKLDAGHSKGLKESILLTKVCKLERSSRLYDGRLMESHQKLYRE